MATSLTLSHSASAYPFDAVVIEGGIAGLTAAAFIVRGGAHVLVCEQAAQMGGLFD